MAVVPGGVGVGRAIQHVRTTRTGLSARGLALRAGLGDAYVSKVESGRTDPGLRPFAKLALALGLTPMEVWAIVMWEAFADSEPAEVSAS